MEIIHLNHTIKATVSIGVATASTASMTELFKQADQALYKAKNNGRNRNMK
jgi:diguanylate cyclase (GGDEF)-like protein